MSAVMDVDERVSRFVAGRRKMLIDGEWVDAASGKTFRDSTTPQRERHWPRSPRATGRTSIAPVQRGSRGIRQRPVAAA